MITKTLSTKQQFAYSKNTVSLNFELTEKKGLLKDFIELLEEAVKDVKKLEKSIK